MNVSIPSIFDSFGFDSVPLAQITKRADSVSPRSVLTRQSFAFSSQTVEVTVVWNTARSYRSYLRAMAWQCAKISGPLAKKLFRHVVQFVQQRQVVIGGDVAGRAGIAVPVPGAADIAAAFDDADALDALFAQPSGGQQGGEAAADEQAFDGVVDRGAFVDGFDPGVDLVFRRVRRSGPRCIARARPAGS